MILQTFLTLRHAMVVVVVGERNICLNNGEKLRRKNLQSSENFFFSFELFVEHLKSFLLESAGNFLLLQTSSLPLSENYSVIWDCSKLKWNGSWMLFPLEFWSSEFFSCIAQMAHVNLFQKNGS
jgi:hypothetical protein